MVDKLIEDIVEVTETLMVADEVEIEAFAHPDAKFTLHEQHEAKGKSGGLGKLRKQKAKVFKAKMKEHQDGDGVFKRGSC